MGKSNGIFIGCIIVAMAILGDSILIGTLDDVGVGMNLRIIAFVGLGVIAVVTKLKGEKKI